MKNLSLLPTEKPSRLFKFANQLHLDTIPKDYYKKYNSYITSDEEIKEGDWGLSKLNEIILFGRSYNEKFYKKIILTTDQDLIANGVQAIDDKFLEWFVKNPTVEYVTVERLEDGKYVDYLVDGNAVEGVYENYKIIIPQEESKQEIVINEKCSKCGSSQYQIGKPFCTDEFCNTNIGKASEDYWLKQPYNEDAFVECAKWQSERMYSEEEVLIILDKFLTSMIKGEKTGLLNQWFEQFKKK
jgi:hypothetical protein